MGVDCVKSKWKPSTEIADDDEGLGAICDSDALRGMSMIYVVHGAMISNADPIAIGSGGENE